MGTLGGSGGLGGEIGSTVGGTLETGFSFCGLPPLQSLTSTPSFSFNPTPQGFGGTGGTGFNNIGEWRSITDYKVANIHMISLIF